jgi:hypothetical protein
MIHDVGELRQSDPNQSGVVIIDGCREIFLDQLVQDCGYRVFPIGDGAWGVLEDRDARGDAVVGGARFVLEESLKMTSMNSVKHGVRIESQSA